MTDMPVGPDETHFGAVKGKTRVVRVESGDPVYWTGKLGSKGRLLKVGKSHSFTKDVFLRSKGESVISLTTKGK